jgi:TonB-linked SusC/RagA family outer membrane protein
MKKKKYIVLFMAFCAGISILYGQGKGSDFTVKGVVIYATTEKPIAGARLTMSGALPVMTEESGAFTLTVVDKEKAGGTRILEVSAPGYSTRKYFITGAKTLKIRLYEEGYQGIEIKLQTPFGEESSLQSALSLQTVRPTMSYSAAATPDGMLQGTVTGLNTISRSGQIGSGTNMFLQGFNSLNATSQPLIMVDGVPYDNTGYTSLITNYQTNPLSAIDVKDIETVTVLKDGTGLYGAKGANGVILINTIRATDPSTRMDALVSSGMSFIPNELPMMNTSQYKTYLSDLLVTSGLNATQIQALPYFDTNKPVADAHGRYSGNLDYYRYNNNTDWQKEAYQMAIGQKYYINIKGGDQTALYAISLGYLSQEGILKNTKYNRFNTRFNSDITISNTLNAHAYMSFSYGERFLQNEGPGSTSNLLYNSFIKAPFTAAYKFSQDGVASPNLESADAFGVSNVYSIANNTVLRNLNYRFLGSIAFDYTFNKNWRLDVLSSLHFNKDRERIFLPSEGLAHDTLSNAVVTNESKHRVERLFMLYEDAFISYNQDLDHDTKVKAHAGVRYQSVRSENDFALSYNSSSDDFKSIGYGDLNLRKIGGSIGVQNWFSMYANADFTFQNKYIVSGILASDISSRYDGMSLFPTLSAAWLITSEDFLQDVSGVEFLKMRLSIGKSGNDDIGNYQNRKYYVSQSLLGYNGLVIGNIPNKQLSPEITTKLNWGIDGSFLDDRMHFTLDIYKHDIQDMITFSQAPALSGFDYYLSNGGSMTNIGEDVSVYGRVLNGDVKWDLGLNVSSYKNKVTSLACGTMETNIYGATVQTKVEQPIGVFYGYQTNGIYQYQSDAEAEGLYVKKGSVNYYFNGGDVRFVDNVADNVIDEKDQTVIGDPTPDVFGGITSQISWKRFTIDLKINYSLGGDVFNYTRYKLEAMSNSSNQTQAVLNRWQVDGQLTNMPKATWGDPMGNARFSDRWVEDGSYLRLKNLSLNYDFKINDKVFKSLNLCLTGENLLTFTNYMGLDPEFSHSSSPLYYGVDAITCPQPKAFFLTLKIGL